MRQHTERERLEDGETLTVGDDGDASLRLRWPSGQHVADVTFVLDGDIEPLGATPDVRVIRASFADLPLNELVSPSRDHERRTVGVYKMGTISCSAIRKEKGLGRAKRTSMLFSTSS